MNKYYYQKAKTTFSPIIFVRFLGFVLFVFGISIVVYVFSPLVIWQFTLAPQVANASVTIPIPQHALLTPMTIKSLISSSIKNIGIDDTNASNWFPSYTISPNNQPQPSYFLSIPKLGITDAYVSTSDMNLANHLVSLSGTGVPPEKGNTVIFGHSTLPQWFDQKNYKTIFATLYKLQVGDTFQTTVENVIYTYKIFSISIIEPDDTSVLAQTYDDSYVTLITCTPPGTIWQRLVIKARLQKLQG